MRFKHLRKFVKYSHIVFVLQTLVLSVVFAGELEAQSKSSSDEINIEGRVTSSEDNQGLPGVNVIVKGTARGTVTDIDGKYSLVVPGKDAVLVFSFVGLASQEIVVGNVNRIDVQMSSDVTSLDELVVIGYGSQKKINITGAVDVVSNKMLENRSNTTMSQLLVGTSPGIDFGMDENGYQPGATASMNIRGVGSLNGGQPYVLIDGFPGDINTLNPQDVESVTILKDAAASAIYGARAPFGVMLVTTKSGRKKEKLTVSYTGSVSVVTPSELPQTLDSYTYARVLNEASLNRNPSLYYQESVIDRIIAYQAGDYDYLASLFPATFPMDRVVNWSAMPSANGGWQGQNSGHANNDFWDLATGTNVGQSHNFSVQGGADKTSYYVSLGYVDQASSVEWGDDFYKRFNLSAKIKTQLASWWDVSYQTRFMKNDRHLPSGSRPESNDAYNALFHIIYNSNPTQPMFDSFGNESQGNVKNFFEAGISDDQQTENWQFFSTELRPVKGWKINADFALQTFDEYGLHDGREFYEVNWITGKNSSTYVPSQVNEYHESNYYWSTNLYTSYELSLKDNHNFSILAGMQVENAKSRGMDAQAKSLIVPDIISISTATGAPVVGESLTHWATQGFFGRFTYNYKEKYLLESNVRYDGTSKFLKDSRFGFFPSFSTGWVVSNEDFWAPISALINTLKFRGSYGELGNQNVAAYQDLALIPISKATLDWLPAYNGTGQVGFTQTPSLVSPSLTWETAAMANVGIDMGMFQEKLLVNFDWFERNTTNMIGPSEALPGVLGATAPKSNNTSLQTRGWELSLKWRQTLRNELSYYIGFNLYDSKAVVTKYNNPTGYLGSWREGQQIDEIWGWSTHGMFKSQEEIDNHADQSYIYSTWNTGDLKYEDINGDDVINKGSNTINDPGDQILLGYSGSHYQYGVSAGLSFIGFDLSVLVKGTAKRDKGMNTLDYGYYGFLRSAWSQPKADHLDYYRDEPGTKYVGLYEGDKNINTDAFYTRPYLDQASSAKNQTYNSRFLANYSYLRIQNVQLGYSLPQGVVSRIHLEKLRVYFSGDNLFTMDHLPKGMDATLPGGGYRQSTGKDYRADRIYSFGVNVTY